MTSTKPFPLKNTHAGGRVRSAHGLGSQGKRLDGSSARAGAMRILGIFASRGKQARGASSGNMRSFREPARAVPVPEQDHFFASRGRLHHGLNSVLMSTFLLGFWQMSGSSLLAEKKTRRSMSYNSSSVSSRPRSSFHLELTVVCPSRAFAGGLYDRAGQAVC